MLPRWRKSLPGGPSISRPREAVSSSIRACMNLDPSSCSVVASSPRAKMREWRCCTGWLRVRRRRTSSHSSLRNVSLRTIRRQPWSIAWRKRLKKKGDIREVMTVLLHSPEFWDDGTYRDKVKTPLEFVVSAVRATGAEVDDAMPLTRQINNMGMPLYGAQPPTGYSMKAETWVSSSALLNRMNFALALTSGKIKGVKVDVAQLAGSNAPSSPPADSTATLSALEASLLTGDVSKQTHDSITAQINGPKIDAAQIDKAKTDGAKIDGAVNGAPAKQNNKAGASKPANSPRPPDVSTIAGLLLGSPEFQRR